MTALPSLTTARLLLRAFAPADGPRVELLAGAPEVAAYTLNIPHPYPAGLAARWIAGHPESFASGASATWAIVGRADDLLLGAISLRFEPHHSRAELGYWLGREYWGRGYTSEAAAAVRDYAFGARGIHRLMAMHLPENPASGRVMQKIGMRYEGLLRGHSQKDGRFYDLVVYGMVQEDWQGLAGAAAR